MLEDVVPRVAQLQALRLGQLAEQSHQGVERAAAGDVRDGLEMPAIEPGPRLEVAKLQPFGELDDSRAGGDVDGEFAWFEQGPSLRALIVPNGSKQRQHP